MKADERQRQILVRARADGRVEVGSLAADLDVAEETVRRDLRALDEHGLLQRMHGGAYPVESAGFESNISTARPRSSPRSAGSPRPPPSCSHGRRDGLHRRGLHPAARRRGAAATDRPAHRGHRLPAGRGALADAPNVTVLLLGGRVAAGTLATVDHWAPRMLAGFVIDLAFIGANGISREHGLTTPDPAVAEVKAQASRGRAPPDLRRPCTRSSASRSFCRFAEISRLRDDRHRHRRCARRGPPATPCSDRR